MKIVARCFCGLGLNLSRLNISNERPDNRYLDEQLSTSIFTCISGDGALYFGIEPCFPWQRENEDMPEDEMTAKHMIAEHLINYLGEERVRLKKKPEEYEDELECEMPTLDTIINEIHYIDDSWTECW